MAENATNNNLPEASGALAKSLKERRNFVDEHNDRIWNGDNYRPFINMNQLKSSDSGSKTRWQKIKNFLKPPNDPESTVSRIIYWGGAAFLATAIAVTAILPPAGIPLLVLGMAGFGAAAITKTQRERDKGVMDYDEKHFHALMYDKIATSNHDRTSINPTVEKILEENSKALDRMASISQCIPIPPGGMYPGYGYAGGMYPGYPYHPSPYGPVFPHNARVEQPDVMSLKIKGGQVIPVANAPGPGMFGGAPVSPVSQDVLKSFPKPTSHTIHADTPSPASPSYQAAMVELDPPSYASVAPGGQGGHPGVTRGDKARFMKANNPMWRSGRDHGASPPVNGY